MDTGRLGNTPATTPGVEQVLNDTNNASNQAIQNVEALAQSQTALGQVFFSLIQQVLAEGQRNASNGA